MGTTYKRLPCTTCIVFARCQHKTPLNCKILYRYMYNNGSPPCKSTASYRIKLIEVAFKKIIKEFYVVNRNEIRISWTTAKQIEEDVMMHVFGYK